VRPGSRIDLALSGLSVATLSLPNFLLGILLIFVFTDFSAALRGPTWAHLLGTDQLGRDSLSRALAGARLSMLVAVGTVVLGLLGGLPLGLISALRRGWLSAVIRRVMDGILAFPGLILAMAIAFFLAVLGCNFVGDGLRDVLDPKERTRRG
jgi:peptide/nickel transport system permease protein